MVASLKEQAKAYTPDHGREDYRGYVVLYPMGRFFVYKDNEMVWSAESMTECKTWIDERVGL